MQCSNDDTPGAVGFVLQNLRRSGEIGQQMGSTVTRLHEAYT